jgi:hypothetical protein
VEPRLVPLNAVLALAAAVPAGWPAPLRAVGYEVAALELPLQTPLGSVHADAVLWRPGPNRFLLVEAKSGANVDEEQAKAICGG